MRARRPVTARAALTRTLRRCATALRAATPPHAPPPPPPLTHSSSRTLPHCPRSLRPSPSPRYIVLLTPPSPPGRSRSPVYHSINARVPSVPPRRVPLRARNVPTNSYQFRPWLLRGGQPAGRWPRPGQSQRGSRCVFRRAVLVLASGGAAAVDEG
eukprot:scaffold56865_cov71-Phaeocystis_antarctica.AAC.3